MNKALYKIYLVACFAFFSMNGFTQTIDVEYINPEMGSGDPYKFIRFGNPNDYKAGFLWNLNAPPYGNGDDFSIFTYDNRDISFYTGTGNLIVFPQSGGNVGIGTTNPGKKLEIKGGDGVGIRLFNEIANTWDILNTQYGKLDFVRGGINTYMRIDQHGNIGIGTTSPTEKLDVNGKTIVNSLRIDSNNPIPSVNGFSNRMEFTTGGTAAIVFHPGELDELMFGMHNNGNFYWGTGSSATNPNYYSMYLNGNNGDLGIRGKLTSNEVKVKIGGWSDFVFENSYALPTLKEVEQHIKEKGHLKDIPSAKDVEENGIYLGEMNAKLLQKIEELTLYAIEQEKKINELKKVADSNEELKNKVAKLEILVEQLINDKN